MEKITLDENFDKLYQSKFPKAFKGELGKEKLVKVLSLCLEHPIGEVCRIHTCAPRTIYWWLKQIYKDDYEKVLKLPRVHLIIRQPKPLKRKKDEDPTEYFMRIRYQVEEHTSKCSHKCWAKKCSHCGKILESDSSKPTKLLTEQTI